MLCDYCKKSGSCSLQGITGVIEKALRNHGHILIDCKQRKHISVSRSNLMQIHPGKQ